MFSKPFAAPTGLLAGIGGTRSTMCVEDYSLEGSRGSLVCGDPCCDSEAKLET